MIKFSVIILAKNEERTIAAAVASAKQVSDDVLLVDSGSTDRTIPLATAGGARVLSISWPGFGAARNLGAAAAKYEWVFCLDADEVITGELAASLRVWQPDGQVLYGCRRRNFVASHEIRYGEWGHDRVMRLYNRNYWEWNADKVHENVVRKDGGERRRMVLPGALLHYTTTDLDTYRKKLDNYARLSAVKFFEAGKKGTFSKRYLSPVFGFVKNYITRMGFLDGSDGLRIALLHAGYTRKKYRCLDELYKLA
ncbi:MAG: glycosyltransferase family 2 protein [Chitinophagaceae bacterium]|nr:MAG: glycosyltransferase family 2 protein [Chitinophagaceae bacterium]